MLRRLLSTNRKTTRARVLARLAGAAAGLRQTRRGSFLIMVIGTLALLSVITVVYVSIGRSDRQTSAAAVKADERRDVPGEIRDYLSGVIADDLFDTVYLGERNLVQNPSGGALVEVPVFRLEAWDYPSAATGATLFDGNGNGVEQTAPITVGGIYPGSSRPDYFEFHPTGNGTGTDPWLASSEPVLMDFNNNANYSTDPTEYFRERLDWMNLSDFAPDGAAVNLYNLRGRSKNGYTLGNFDATPWEMRGRQLDADSAGAQVTLFGADPANGARNRTLDYGAQAADPTDADAKPAEWFGRQRWAVYPNIDPRYGPGDPEYMPYQYADADGDGILDSRWIELVEDRDPDDSLVNYLLTPDDRMRYFVAVRAVDLSGRVNVNTATDSSLGPIAEDPYGLTPSAIDLKRLLTGEDFFTDQRTTFPGNSNYGMSYRDHIQPNFPKNPNPDDPANYEGYYTEYGAVANSYYAGEKAYDALRMVLDTSVMPLAINPTTPGAGYRGLLALTGDGVVEREFSLAGGTQLNGYWSPYWKVNAPFGPTDYYTLSAGFGPEGGAGLPDGGTLTSGLGRAFGADSLFELLAYNGVNNDRIRSPLEAALDGRANPANLSTAALADRFGPLRDNRPTDDVERLRGGWQGRNYQFYDQAKAALYTDIRQRLTTLSLARPLVADRIPADPDPQVNNLDVPDKSKLTLTRSNPTELDPDVSHDTKWFVGELCKDASRLYKLYARALAPSSDQQGEGSLGDQWDTTNAAQFNETRTLYYGYHGPYLALRTAAHLAVNMADAFDDDNDTTKRTVLINGSQIFRTTGNLFTDSTKVRPAAYPWKLLDLDDLQENETDDNGNTKIGKWLYRAAGLLPDPNMAEAVNVFGIEAQPFITEAASLIMYTDTPEFLGGDDDTGKPLQDGGGGSGSKPRETPTINGRVLDGNPDFLFEVIAFQVHNPFHESITLSGNAGSDGGIETARRDLFYIQYGDKYYKLTRAYDAADGARLAQEEEIVLGPGDSITFYALSENREKIAERINKITVDANYGGRALGYEKDRLKAWLNKQLGENAVQVAPFDRNTGALRTDEFLDLQSGTPDDRRVVRLFRVEKPEEETNIPINGVTEDASHNDTDNDAVVDRLRDPEIGKTGSTVVSLDRHGPHGTADPDKGSQVRGADRGWEPPKPPPNGDNRGLTITLFASIRRHDDPHAGMGNTGAPRAGLPAYCVESKSQSDGELANVVYDDTNDLAHWDISFFSGQKGGAKTLDQLLNKQTGLGDPPTIAVALVPTISEEPREKPGGSVYDPTRVAMIDNLAGVPFEGGTVGSAYYPPRYAEPNLNDFEFRVDTNGDDQPQDTEPFVMRVSDLLLPLGIGPCQIPRINGADVTDEDVEWTTLSEALATALYYENDTTPSNVYADAFVPPPTPADPDNTLLDRGCLRYDAFVPFRDTITQNGEFDPGEPTWGLGVPLAATILDQVTALDPKFASLTAPTQGVLNINTASRETLRSLPGLSPPEDTNPDGSTRGWWWTTNAQQDWRSDIATTLAAYRDRVYLYPRDTTGGQPTQPVDFRSWWDLAAGTRVNPFGFAPPGENPGDNARWGTTGVAGIREQPGVRSLGEILFLRDFGYPAVAGYDYAQDIDRLGYDTKNLDQDVKGLDSIDYDFDNDGTLDDDEIDDDYAERLALANGVMASSSIRSDVFAVWFLVHGYQESDVKGLGPQDPMVPSIARRFVMVVDRSNVTKPGDKPKILLFKEVPL